MATHSSVLAWEIPWTEEPGGLQSTGYKESDRTERPNNNHFCPDSPEHPFHLLHLANLDSSSQLSSHVTSYGYHYYALTPHPELEKLSTLLQVSILTFLVALTTCLWPHLLSSNYVLALCPWCLSQGLTISGTQ